MIDSRFDIISVLWLEHKFFYRERKDYSGKHTIEMFHISDTPSIAYRYEAVDYMPHGLAIKYDTKGRIVEETIYFQGNDLHINAKGLTKKDILYIMLNGGRMPPEST